MRKVVVLLILSLYLLAPPIPTSTGPETPGSYRFAPLGGTDYPWTMFHHDSQRTGATLASAPSTPSLMWTYDTGAVVYSSPAVVDGTIFITTYGTSTGSLYAIDEYTGQQKWVFPTSAPIYASPAVANGIVYLASRDSFLYAIDASTGLQLWRVPNISPLTSSPVVANGKVFYGTWFNRFWAELVALDAYNGTVIWRYQAADDTIKSSPAVHNGRVFFGQNNGYVVALNETTRVEMWKTRLPNPGQNTVISTAPAIAYGRVYVGAENRFAAFDELTGTHLWDFPTAGMNATSGAVYNGVIYFGTGEGKVNAVNATTGSLIWSYTVGGPVSSSPALALGSNTLVVGAHDRYIYALNMTDGALVWSYQSGSVVSSSPAVADGRVFVGSQDHRVYAIGPAAPTLQASMTTSKTALKPGEVSILTITVTNGTNPESGVTLSITSSSGGGFTTPVEQVPGTYTSNYTAPLVSQQTDTTITVTASKSGFLDDTATTTITLSPFPALTVAVTPRPSSVTPGSDVLLIISVNNGTQLVSGASIFLSSDAGGSFSGLMDGGNGNYTAVYATGLGNSSPTLVVQASKPGFSTGQAQVTITISGVPDLTNLKFFGVPLFLIMMGLFLMAFVVFVAIVARRKGEPDYSERYLPGYVFKPGFSREGLSTRFRCVFSMGLAAIAGS